MYMHENSPIPQNRQSSKKFLKGRSETDVTGRQNSRKYGMGIEQNVYFLFLAVTPMQLLTATSGQGYFPPLEEPMSNQNLFG